MSLDTPALVHSTDSPSPSTQPNPPDLPTSLAPSHPLSPVSPNGSATHSSLLTPVDAPNITTNNSQPDSPPPSSAGSPDVDPQIVEALRSKDRIYVLKLGELMEGLINDRRARIDLSPTTSYQRLLVHRCSAYYKLAPENDPVGKGIFVLPTLESRIPSRRICELVPAESTAHPAFKIMRRSASDRKTKPNSQAGSVAGEDADLSDIEPSEAGSLGGRSNATGGSHKKRMTIEEREAAYNEARSRIFMDFEEKEKEKDKDMSASSSSLSVVSSSASLNSGSVGDPDDRASSPATESEWSGPVTRDRKESRRGGSAASSSRSLRSGAPSFHASNSGSSRNSRAPSPSFTYASLYEPPPSAPLYDPSQHPAQTGYPSQYLYPYSAPGHPNPPYNMSPHPYYAPHYNPYQSPPPHPQSAPEMTTDPYQQPQHMNYSNPYFWPQPAQPSLQSPPQMQSRPLPQQQQQPPLQNSNNVITPPPQGHQPPQYLHYAPSAHAYTYPSPMGGYYTAPPGHHMPAPPHMAMQQPMYNMSHPINGNMSGNVNGHNPSIGRPHLGNGILSPNESGHSPSKGSMNGNGNGSSKSRNGIPPLRAQTAWSYGPGVGQMGGPVTSSNGEAMGPRLNTTRRASANSRSSSNCDDVSSTASSSTASSSSKRTFTSTASSQHPLPPRPDWAVGLKPQPMLAGRHHDHSGSHAMSPVTPPRSHSGSSSPHSIVSRQHSSSGQVPPMSLQLTDFPPLSSVAPTAEKRTPVATGAWGNSSSTRSILQVNTPGNALINHNQATRLEEPIFERPPPKSAQLFNPKVVTARPAVNGNGPSVNGKIQGQTDQEKERTRGDVVASAILVDQLASVSLEDQVSEDSSEFRELSSVTT